MVRRRSRAQVRRVRRPARHGRHGREDRSPVVRPPLPPLDTRAEQFELAVGTTAEFLRSSWPELRDVGFEVADLPPAAGERGIPRWRASPEDKRIVLYRVPIERLGHRHRVDDVHRRMMVETCVFRAAAEYLDRDPWDLGPERFRFL